MAIPCIFCATWAIKMYQKEIPQLRRNGEEIDSVNYFENIQM